MRTLPGEGQCDNFRLAFSNYGPHPEGQSEDASLTLAATPMEGLPQNLIVVRSRPPKRSLDSLQLRSISC
jgi:hypothetical protein